MTTSTAPVSSTEKRTWWFDESKTRLRILVVSDMHAKMECLHALAKWATRSHEEIDLILLPGDLGSFKSTDVSIPEKCCECEGEMSSVIGYLENLCTRVVYIPGNHDAPSTYTLPTPRLTTNSVNIHGLCIRIAPNLVIAGFGGSMPAQKGGVEYEYGAFPFRRDDQISEGVVQALSSTETPSIPISTSICPTDSIILMTHVGPSNSSTTVDNVSVPCVYAGSNSLAGLLSESKWAQQTILNVHGHTHKAPGACYVGKIPVLNGGALQLETFALVTLEKSPDRPLWRATSLEIHSL
ncbi:ser/thr phosphatase family protein [Pelomyxa schiedti]|nr:ser/thr phosphatase family protein [Pelomyxa schiedti]